MGVQDKDVSAMKWDSEAVRRKLHRKLPGQIVDGSFLGLAWLGKCTPLASNRLYGVEKIKNISYGSNGKWSLLDIYRPKKKSETLPVVLYVHGGAFRALSKDTHWVMGRNFARRGYIVVSINYRLAPQYPYPAAIQDVCLAWKWVVNNIEQYGGNPDNIMVAGESVGANLTMALTIACCYPRAELWAREVYDLNKVPSAILPACGLFQVSNPGRLLTKGIGNRLVYSNLKDIEDCYLPTKALRQSPGLADPVCILEKESPEKPLPPAFLPVGTWDPLVVENQRLKEALHKRGAIAIERHYARGVHAFHALIFLKIARQCWNDMIEFSDAYRQ